MKRARDSSETATRPISEISISAEPDLVLSEEWLRLDAEERRQLEAEAFRQMQAIIEAQLFAIPAGAGLCVGPEPVGFLFYRPKS